MFNESLLQMAVWSIFKTRVSLFLFSKHIVGEVVKLVSAFYDLIWNVYRILGPCCDHSIQYIGIC